MPRTWYNVRADMKVKPAPLRNPATGAPMAFDDLRPVFCDELIRQELDNDGREIPIPDEIRDFYKMYRPSPLVRAYCLEEKLGTPAKIYYKFEVVKDRQRSKCCERKGISGLVDSFSQLYFTINLEEIFYFNNKKCRIYAAFGVSQTPK